MVTISTFELFENLKTMSEHFSAVHWKSAPFNNQYFIVVRFYENNKYGVRYRFNYLMLIDEKLIDFWIDFWIKMLFSFYSVKVLKVFNQNWNEFDGNLVFIKLLDQL